MQLNKRGKYYQLGYVDPNTGIYKRITTGCTDKVAAESFQKNYERRLHDPVHAASANYFLHEAFTAMLTWARVQEKKRPKTLGAMENHARQMVRVFSKLKNIPADPGPKLSDIVPGLVDAYGVARLEEGISKLTVYKELCTLRKTLKRARKGGLYALDPETVVSDWQAEYEPRTGVLTREETEKLLAELQPSRVGHVAYLFGTAARYEESTRARRTHFHWDRETVFIDGSKTKKSKNEIPVVPFLKPFLDRALREAPGDDLMFLPWGSYNRDIRAACDRAKVPEITPNDIRRSVVTWMAQAGIPAELAITVTRHTDTKMIRKVYDQSKASDMVRHIKNALLAAEPPVKRTAARKTKAA